MNIVIVIVTYNRLEKLKKALSLYENQTASFNSLIIVDNGSSDGTIEYLKEWEIKQANYEKHLILLGQNLGGSGGFYEGQKYALSLNPDWIYVSDDDAYPANNMIELFINIINETKSQKIAAVCGAVLNPDNSIAYSHRSNYYIKKGYKFTRIDSSKIDYSKLYFKIDLLSYVATFINANALREVGLCNPNYFIYFDDTEHSIRLKQFGDILCYPSLRVLHDIAVQEATKNKPIVTYWKEYYSIRNEIFTLKKTHFISAIYLSCRHLYSFFKSFIRSLSDNQEKYYYKLVITAIINAWLSKLGKHETYKPGFIIFKDNKIF